MRRRLPARTWAGADARQTMLLVTQAVSIACREDFGGQPGQIAGFAVAAAGDVLIGLELQGLAVFGEGFGGGPLQPHGGEVGVQRTSLVPTAMAVIQGGGIAEATHPFVDVARLLSAGGK